MIRRLRFALLLIVISISALADTRPPSAAIAAAHPAAVAAGKEIFDAGGNAFDAAVAVAAALAVVEPYSSGIGGGGFFLLHRASDKRHVMIDARERAPGKASANMYLDQDGKPIPRASLDGALAAAIPGLPAALAHLAERYGTIPLARSLAPAVRLAREGFAVTPRYREWAAWRRDAMVKYGAGRVFLLDNDVPPLGHVIRQPDLADTIERLGRTGARDFYRGETARRLVQATTAAGGIWTSQDLAEYNVIERRPFEGMYRGARIVTASLPSSGGIVMLGALGILEHLAPEKAYGPERTHLIVEAMRRAYHDRALHLGDADFIAPDIATRLLDRARLKKLAHAVDRNKATPSDTLERVPSAQRPQGQHTTHFSIIDTAGNRVAATLTINTSFGSAFVAGGTGVLLNNEMDDFSIAPNTPNIYGLVGGAANAIAPGKRPLSSMTPTFVETGDRVVVLGTPGGSRIISMVLLATLEAVHTKSGPAAWVAQPRFHHQYLPDRIDHEANTFSAEERGALERKGHTLRVAREAYGNMQIVVWDVKNGRLDAAADPRGEGAAAVFVPRSGEQKKRAPVGAR